MLSAKRAARLFVVFLVVAGPTTGLAVAADADLDAQFTQSRVVNNGYGGATNSTLVVDAPADDAVYVGSDSFDASTLAKIFGGEVVGDRVRVSLPADGRIEAEFRCVEIGDVRFTVTGVDSDASDTATIAVRSHPVGEVSLVETIMVTAPEETVRIPVATSMDCEPEETIRIVVGSHDAGFKMTANVTVQRGAEDVALVMDLDRAGQSFPERYLSVHNATLENATLHTLPLDRPLETGEYNVSLYRDGLEVDIGLMFVREPTPTPTPTPAPTPSPTLTPSPAPAPSSTPTATPPATASSTASLMSSETPTPTSSPQKGADEPATVPGFGFGIALVGAALAGLLAARRP